jgi:ABC-type nitrate/sulfonate/bicarbonate transport system ATPase subunit
VGVRDAARQLPAQLSLGTQQCVSLARALSTRPRFLLLDEPFSTLDSMTRFDLQDTLLQAWERHDRKVVVMVTHDIDEALYLADRLILMTDGPAARVGEILSLPFARPRFSPDVSPSRTLSLVPASTIITGAVTPFITTARTLPNRNALTGYIAPMVSFTKSWKRKLTPRIALLR